MGSWRKSEARSTDVAEQRKSIGQPAVVEQRPETDMGEKRMRGKGKETREKIITCSLIWGEIWHDRLVPCGTTVPPVAGPKKSSTFLFSVHQSRPEPDQRPKMKNPWTEDQIEVTQSGPVRSSPVPGPVRSGRGPNNLHP